MTWLSRLIQRWMCPAPPPTPLIPPQNLLPEIRDVHRRLDDLITALEQYDQALQSAPRPDPAAGDGRTSDA